MADDDLQHLKSARAALAKKRLSLAQTIAASADDGAIKAIIEVQEAIEVIDLATEELEQVEVEEDADEDD